VYETDPVGYAEQPCFLNAALRLETELSPAALLGACLGIEAALGRKRNFANGPRAIDIDLLLYEGFCSTGAELTLPHPRMLERAFVLIPLADLYPSGEAPGVSFATALATLSRDGVRETGLSLAQFPLR
jgi:2-amino-4-hydroxy-6-hydroxymethyldihydropteridine diphosphokinase